MLNAKHKLLHLSNPPKYSLLLDVFLYLLLFDFQNFLNKNKDGGMHHICLEVDNIKAAMKHLKQKGIRCLGEEPRIGAHGKPVIFLHPKDCAGVLIELEEV